MPVFESFSLFFRSKMWEIVGKKFGKKRQSNNMLREIARSYRIRRMSDQENKTCAFSLSCRTRISQKKSERLGNGKIRLIAS